jgi:hypothetical protein
MKAALAFGIIGTAVAVQPPRIELNLEGLDDLITESEASTIGIVSGVSQPDGTPVQSRQDWTERCPAGAETNEANCPRPVAHAWDHHENEVEVVERIFLVNEDKEEVNVEITGDIDYTGRRTYLFKYDASDSAGNHAEQVVFALILDDPSAPAIETCMSEPILLTEDGAEQVEAASNWDLCSNSAATDNIDLDVSPTIVYRVTHDGDELCSNAPYNVAAQYIDTTLVGDFNVEVEAHDHAGVYGVDAADNYNTADWDIKVVDTRDPWITINGVPNLEHECGVVYEDDSATVHDLLDTVANHQTLPVDVDNQVNSAVVSEEGSPYTVTYTAEDTAGNDADPAVRTVTVVDNTAPSITLVGAPEIVHHAESDYVDHGVQISDTCETDIGLRIDDVVKTWISCPAGAPEPCGFNPYRDETTGARPTLGTYTLEYSITDENGNTNTVTRSVTMVDVTAPEITITDWVQPFELLEAEPDGIYTDAHATCEDYVHGDISNAVIATVGDTGDVDLATPDIYEVHYNCKDASDNSAATVTRVIHVEDNTCPNIWIHGEPVVHIEAGFPYEDAGAYASDSLDGWINGSVVTDNTVNTAVHWVAASSCQQIKDGMLAQGFAADTIIDGTYFITTLVDDEKTRTEVWCDMAHGATYKGVFEGTAVVPYGGVDGDCTDYGMVMASWPAGNADPSKGKAMAHFTADTADSSGNAFFPSSAASETDHYVCTDDTSADIPNPYLEDGTHHSQISAAEAGEYVITYTVEDAHGNGECEPKYRTVVVQDTLPPVITLHMEHDDGDLGRAFQMSDASQTGVGGEENLAGDLNVNPNLANNEEGDFSEHHEWFHPEDFSLMDPMAPIDALAEGYSHHQNNVVGSSDPNLSSQLGAATLMAEREQGSSSWVMLGAASAVAGLALVAASSRKQRIVTSVPV